MARLSWLFVCLFALAPAAQAEDAALPALVYGGAAVADLWSTEAMLARGGVESTPWMRDRAARIAIEGGVAFGLYHLDRYFQRRARTEPAWKWAVWGERAVTVAAAVLVVRHNGGIARGR